MIRKATHIIVSFLLLITTAGFSISKQSCKPTSLSVDYMEFAASHCKMPSEDCNAQIIAIKIESSFTGTTQTISVDQVADCSPASGTLVQVDASDGEPVYTFSTFKLPKIQTVLARLQTYLL